MLSICYDVSGMKEYYDILLKRQKSQIEALSRSGRHLFQLLKWSIVDTSTTVNSVLSYCPASSLWLESGPSESHSKIQLWSRILSDAFIYNLVHFEPIWEYHQLVPEHFGSGSSYCDFVAVVKDERRNRLFPFFIIEFERHDREIHKDHAVVAAEAAFELNRLLSLVPESKVLEVRVHVGLISNSIISLGILRPFYNDDRTAILFAYDRDVATFSLRDDSDKLLNALKLLVYLREVVCKDGLIIKDLVDNSPGICDNVTMTLPKLPTWMEKSRESSTYTPKIKKVKYGIDMDDHYSAGNEGGDDSDDNEDDYCNE
ncbi:hypothetical protein C2G38_2250649 [Gigaspora rosea]|uniref:Uncharacterized protein n=1 Tax=Gigaspora rosea TaxID=44941 RepID=A0A397UN84_9GLOM|nr:hypothetical protein C2G38_2250649 [Gigaspora rosea]